jgi:hypothetical protein
VIKLSAVDNGYKCNTTLKTSAESLNLRFFSIVCSQLMYTMIMMMLIIIIIIIITIMTVIIITYLLFYSKNLKQIYSKKRKKHCISCLMLILLKWKYKNKFPKIKKINTERTIHNI